MKQIVLAGTLLLTSLLKAQSFTLKSTELGGQASQKQVANSFGCKGENKSPQLYWENPPAGTQSFAVTIYDEDAPTGSGWWHWIIFDIDKNTSELETGAGDASLLNNPAHSIQSKTDFGVPGYGGPCPPPGETAHRYVVTVYALKVAKLGLDATANPALVGFYLEQQQLEKASIVFYYKQ